ncbi:MAG TPA: hypothetical protein VID26_10735 [Candidatus Limnocylindrales bacterium]|jgi:spore coat polysaccharide biosynthesis predicted glycosyltransferase SpsG
MGKLGESVVRLVATGAAHEGRGHVSRALAVAEALDRAGARTEIELIRGELTQTELRRIAGWRHSIRGRARHDPDAVVLDVPDLAAVAGRFDPDRLVVFDDAATFAGRAAIVVQTSLPSWTGPGAAGRVLAGYAFAPISAAYRRLRDRPIVAATTRAGALPRVVICFGGSDPDDVLGRVGMGLATDPRWAADVIVGAAYDGRATSWTTPVVRDPPDLPERLAAADMAVLGAGTMKFEAACVGVPAILLVAADDQLDGVWDYAATDAAMYLGDGRTVDPTAVVWAAGELLADRGRLAALSRAAHELIDGRGAERIAEAILGLVDHHAR